MKLRLKLTCVCLLLQSLVFGQLNRPNYDVISYQLDLSVDIENQSISGRNSISFNVLDETSSIQVHLAKRLKVHSIYFENQPIDYLRDGDTVTVFFQQRLKKNTSQIIVVYYSGKPQVAMNPPWDGGFVWEKDSMGRPWVGVSCEGIGASTWWPTNNDLSDKADSVKINVTVPLTSDSLSVACNGTLKNIQRTKDSTTFQWLIQNPITNYNLTLNIGAYKQFHETYLNGGNEVLNLDYYVLDYHEYQAKRHFKQVPEILKVFEELYGEYPFPEDGYALIETSYWGMEHQSGISYGNKFRNNVMGYDFIILHESGHEYWGNAVGINDFAELWINEAFTTYTETLFFEKIYGKNVALTYLKNQQRQITNSEVLLGKMGVNFSFKTTDIYYKGAWMLHTVRTALNNDVLFFEILKEIQTEFKYKTISTLEVLSVFKKHIRTFDVEGVMMHYLSSLAIPELHFSKTKNKKKQQLQFHWGKTGASFDLPIWVSIDGKTLVLKPNQIVIGKEIEVLNLDSYLIEIKE